MNIFITGANGFVGSRLKEYLAQYYDYTLFTPSRCELDLSDEKAVDDYILSHKIDIIIHTANRGGGRDTIDMKSVVEYNLRIFFNISKHEKNVKKIISFGSGAEYFIEDNLRHRIDLGIESTLKPTAKETILRDIIYV